MHQKQIRVFLRRIELLPNLILIFLISQFTLSRRIDGRRTWSTTQFLFQFDVILFIIIFESTVLLVIVFEIDLVLILGVFASKSA